MTYYQLHLNRGESGDYKNSEQAFIHTSICFIYGDLVFPNLAGGKTELRLGITALAFSHDEFFLQRPMSVSESASPPMS